MYFKKVCMCVCVCLCMSRFWGICRGLSERDLMVWSWVSWRGLGFVGGGVEFFGGFGMGVSNSEKCAGRARVTE